MFYKLLPSFMLLFVRHVHNRKTFLKNTHTHTQSDFFFVDFSSPGQGPRFYRIVYTGAGAASRGGVPRERRQINNN